MNLGDLSNRLQDKIAKDRQVLEKIATNELLRLKETLLDISKNALHTTETAIIQRTEAMAESISQNLSLVEKNSQLLSRTMARTWFKSFLLGSGVVLGVAIGTWSVTSILTHRLASLMEDITDLQGRQIRLERTVSILESQTWGIQLMESEKGRFLILPQGVNPKSGWRAGEHPALKLE